MDELTGEEKCPICVTEIPRYVAMPNECRHVFCLSCLSKWSKVANTCPLDRLVMTQLKVYDMEERIYLKSVNVHSGTFDENASINVCYICECSMNDDDEILSCAFCDLKVHLVCSGLSLNGNEEILWFCINCDSPSAEDQLDRNIIFNLRPTDIVRERITTRSRSSTNVSENEQTTLRRSSRNIPNNRNRLISVSSSCSEDSNIVPPTSLTCGEISHLVSPTSPTSGVDSHLVSPTSPTSGEDSDLVSPTSPTSGEDSNLISPTSPTSGEDSHLVSPTSPTCGEDSHLVSPRSPTSYSATSTLVTLPITGESIILSSDEEDVVPSNPSQNHRIEEFTPIAKRTRSRYSLPVRKGILTRSRTALLRNRGCFSLVGPYEERKRQSMGESEPAIKRLRNDMETNENC
ncbi:hypothetical protein SNEBB_006433 [Seison nebaliae]|nr:hypothetical protein SNEBB_006433 [Seison nebaliae]